ncbi:ABC transporter permease [Georgenia sp. MJ206]|uniref:ABC transporter permease n=1 Tax=Georgenia wangjunii TaxID=3117730 RepID=UPI002F2607A1
MSATATSRVLAQAAFETRAVLRNGEQLLLTFILPAVALVLLVRTDVLGGSGAHARALAGVLALAAVSTGFTSQAIAVAFDRRWGVLRLLATTPLGPRGLLLGKLGAVLAVLAVQVVVLSGVALGLGWRPAVGDALAAAPAAAVLLLLGAGAFTALGMLVGGTLRPEAVLALANTLWVLLVAGGGVVLPLTSLPGWLGAVVAWLPSGALGEGMRDVATGGGMPWLAAAVLLAWTALLAWLAGRAFRWE